MQDLERGTIQEVVEVFEGELTEQEVKSIIYSAYSYPSRIDDSNVNDVNSLLAFIDWDYQLRTKQLYGRISVTIID